MSRYCVICGNELITEGNDMLSDVLGGELPEDEDAMITYAHCPKCKCDYEMRDASKREIEADEGYVGSFVIYQPKEETTI